MDSGFMYHQANADTGILRITKNQGQIWGSAQLIVTIIDSVFNWICVAYFFT